MIRRAAALAATLAAVLALAVPSTVLGQATTVDQLKYPPLPEFSLATPKRTVLPNGMVLLIMENSELPLVSITARIRTGSLLEPAEKAGVASLTGSVLRSGGTEAMSPDQLDTFLEDRAASIEAGIGEDAGTASMSVLKEDFVEVLQVFADVLRRPRFDEARLQVAKRGVEAGIARQNDDAGAISSREFRKLIYGADSPFARSVTYSSLGAIGRDDLRAWHAKYFHPNQIIMAIHGDVTEADAKAAVIKAFGDWPKGDATSVAFPEPSPRSPTGVYEALKTDVAQSSIRVGHQGQLLSTNPDYYPVEILNEVLSGSFTSRLFSTVRTQKGLAYSVGGSVGSQFTRIAPFGMVTSTKTSTTVEAIETLIAEAKRIIAEPPSEAEIARAKQAILNSFVFNSATKQQVLGQQLTYEYYDVPRDWLARYRAGIEKVTPAQVAAVAKKYIQPERFAILVVGPEEGRDKPLGSLGDVKRLDITIPEPAAAPGTASGAASGAKGPATATAPPDAAASTAGRALVEKAVTAMGGPAAVDSVKSYRETSALVVNGPQGEMSLDATATFALPDRIRQDVTTPMGQMSMVVAGEQGVAMMPGGGARPLPPTQRDQIRQQLRQSPLVLLQRRSQKGFTAAVVGEARVGEVGVQLVRIEVEGTTVTLGIDPQSGHVRQLTYRGPGPTGAPADVVTEFDDFRAAGSLTVPHARTTSINGEVMQRSKVSAVEVNPTLADDVFAIPAAQP